MANGLANLSHKNTTSNKDYTTNMPKLTRGFSKVQANQVFVNETRSHIENNYRNLNDLNEINYLNKFLNNELTCYSFMLPNLNQFEDYKFKEYLQNDLLEMPAQYNLTESGHLNWWTQNNWENVCRPLYPMITSGDGNCLLHAASLAMWGLHDRYLILRKALNSTLKQIKEDNSSPLWRRWKWEQMCQNRKYGLIYNNDEWAKEWQSLLKLSSYQPRMANQQTTSTSSNKHSEGKYQNSTLDNQSHQSSSSISSSSLKSTYMQGNNQDSGTCYFESLEEFHVFLLADILQRPIIIVSDTMLHDLNGDPLSPIPFGGIYLPFECELSKCHRYPLVLAYDSAHFSALVLMDEDKDLYENEQENYYDDEPERILTNKEINQLNKKLQLRPPYSIIPIQYSNKELLPIHFAYDPGEDYDWSNFPTKNFVKQTKTGATSNNKLSSTSNSSSNHSLNDNMSVSSSNNNKNLPNFNHEENDSYSEMTRSEKMFLIQKYLDICKLELFDSGPLSTKRNTQVFNSNGMCASIYNIQVPVPFSINGIDSKAHKSKSTNRFQKFFLNLFKRSSTSEVSKRENKSNNETNEKNNSIFSSKLRKSIRNNYAPSQVDNKKSTLTTISSNPQVSNENSKSLTPKLKVIQSPPDPKNSKSQQLEPVTNMIFHKIQTYKNWNSLFHSLNNTNSFLGVKLNLAKPPRFRQVILNYIDSARNRLEHMRQQHKAQIILQQQQQKQQQIYLQQQQLKQQQQTLQSKEVFGQRQRLTPRYINVNNGSRKMSNLSAQPKTMPVSHSNSWSYNEKEINYESISRDTYRPQQHQEVSYQVNKHEINYSQTNKNLHSYNNSYSNVTNGHLKDLKNTDYVYENDEDGDFETIHHL